jgi:hypothetical protein
MRATRFPPPLWGRDRERGTTALFSVRTYDPTSHRSRVGKEPLAQRFVATPLPVPPPQGGREPCGAHLRTSLCALRPEMCACRSPHGEGTLWHCSANLQQRSRVRFRDVCTFVAGGDDSVGKRTAPPTCRRSRMPPTTDQCLQPPLGQPPFEGGGGGPTRTGSG